MARNISAAIAGAGRKKSDKHSAYSTRQAAAESYVERYDRTLRHERLEQYIIENIEEAQHHATQWLWTYNNERPLVSCGTIGSSPMSAGIGGMTPAQKLKLAA